MAKEIERKFLVHDDVWRAVVDKSVPMRQGYLALTGTCGIRVRVEGGTATLNVKSAGVEIERHEYEYPIPVEDGEDMLARFCRSGEVAKTRHYVRYADHVWEIDEFGGDNAGLIVAEVELSRADEEFERPPWLGAEVSDDPRYLNAYLAQHPYRRW